MTDESKLPALPEAVAFVARRDEAHGMRSVVRGVDPEARREYDAAGWQTEPLYTAAQMLAFRAEGVAAVAEDAGRLDWLGSLEGVNLISDDGGKWAVSSSGFQPVPQEGGFTKSVAITSFVEPEEWHDTIRAAIDAAMGDDDEA